MHLIAQRWLKNSRTQALKYLITQKLDEFQGILLAKRSLSSIFGKHVCAIKMILKGKGKYKHEGARKIKRGAYCVFTAERLYFMESRKLGLKRICPLRDLKPDFYLDISIY